jgi:hypothetical protein
MHECFYEKYNHSEVKRHGKGLMRSKSCIVRNECQMHCRLEHGDMACVSPAESLPQPLIRVVPRAPIGYAVDN